MLLLEIWVVGNLQNLGIALFSVINAYIKSVEGPRLVHVAKVFNFLAMSCLESYKNGSCCFLDILMDFLPLFCGVFLLEFFFSYTFCGEVDVEVLERSLVHGEFFFGSSNEIFIK